MVAWQYHDNSLSPLANWPLDEYVGGEYEDISGNALPLTVESGMQRDADLVPGFAGTWLDGSTRLVENTGDASLRLLGDWSIAFFVRPTAYPTAAIGSEMATHGAPNAETGEADNFAYQTKLTQTAARIAASWETTGQVDVDVTTVAALVSHVGGHVAIVKRGLDVEVYLDTVLVATATAASQPVGGGNGKFRFGGGTTSAGLAAVVASLVVFGEAITPSELFGPAPPTPVVAELQLFPNEGSIRGGDQVVARSTDASHVPGDRSLDLTLRSAAVPAGWTTSGASPTLAGLELRTAATAPSEAFARDAVAYAHGVFTVRVQVIAPRSVSSGTVLLAAIELYDTVGTAIIAGTGLYLGPSGLYVASTAGHPGRAEAGPVGGAVTLSLARTSVAAFGYMGTVPAWRTTRAPVTEGVVRLRVATRTTSTRVVSRFSDLTYGSGLLIDGVPVLDPVAVGPLLSGKVPATILMRRGPRDVTLFGPWGAVTEVEGFTYTLPAPRTLGRRADVALQTFTDAQLEDRDA